MLLPSPDHAIEKWWSPAHDALIRSRMIERRWWWQWDIADTILAIADPHLLAKWRVRTNQGTRITYYAEDRAIRLGLYAELLGPAPEAG